MAAEELDLLDELRAAVGNLPQPSAARATIYLVHARIISINDGTEFSRALVRLRDIFSKIDEWEAKESN
jgi:hypothetical protein